MRTHLRIVDLVIIVGACLALMSACGTQPNAAGSSPSPSPAPSWLARQAARFAADWGDAHPTAAYWGLLSDPELGRLTSSGPNDPSHKAYAVVLIGHYDALYSMVHWPSPPSTPLPPIRWVYSIYTLQHQGGGSFGFGPTEFDISRFPSLHSFELPAQ